MFVTIHVCLLLSMFCDQFSNITSVNIVTCTLLLFFSYRLCCCTLLAMFFAITRTILPFYFASFKIWRMNCIARNLYCNFISGAIMMKLSLDMPVEFAVKHPFFYTIAETAVDEESGSLSIVSLFNGRVVEPKI